VAHLGKIIQLDDALSNKIAAGEVVERPASVVKELLENSIDANSTVIEIELEEAGLTKIRIIDNGEGIENEDVLTAFSRHATSKIKDENDLFRIITLGFRGEALPSIASVSKLEMVTSTGEGAGTRIVLEGGKVTTYEQASSRKGTDITVTDLFYNTPARLKYMKTIHTELGNITDIVNRIALAHPEVSIKLVHNERVLLHTNGNGDVRQVLASIYGMNIAKKMIHIHATSLDFQVSGYIALPEITRASRNYISTMINGRFIKNYSLVKAIQEGYHTFLPIGRYPICLIHIEMDPILIDVNVHPSKLEVRLSKEAELNRFIEEAIRTALRKETLIPQGMTDNRRVTAKYEQTAFSLDPIQKPEQSVQQEKIVYEQQKEGIEVIFNSYIANGLDQQRIQNDTPIMMVNDETEQDVSIEKETNQRSVSNVPPLYAVGQVHGTYIIAQNENGLYIVDQHAAQERIKYEFFRKKVGEVSNELQELLIPIPLEFSTDQYVKIEEHLDELRNVGVFLEPFGHNSFIVRNHPVWFPTGMEQQIIEEMIEQVLQMKKVDIYKLREEAAIMMSCKGSIKANHYLRLEDMQSLLDTLRQTTDPFTCPHGRPIIIHFSSYELEKMFKRVM